MLTTSSDNNRTYTGINQTSYNVIEPALASGGEGFVYELEEYPDYVMKVFKEAYCTSEREAKLLKMIQQKLSPEELTQITWPIDVVYSREGFAGYVMTRIRDNKNLNVVYSTMNQFDLRHRMVIAYNLCAAVDIVHTKGQVCGDLNPQNILVNTDLTSPVALHVTIVDTDSFHIVDGDKTYRCEVGLSTYLAPEIQKRLVNGVSLKSAPLPTYTKETDLFSLAVHIFCLVMNGCHPFACAKKTNDGYENDMEVLSDKDDESVVLPQPIENIRDGFFPFFRDVDGITYPLYAPDMKRLPKELADMFIRAFEYGYFDPKNRPTAKEWMDLLSTYQGNNYYAQCDQGHYYLNANTTTCPLCDAKKRMLSVMRANIKGKDVIPPKTKEKVEVAGGEPFVQPYTQKSRKNNRTNLIMVLAVVYVLNLFVILSFCVVNGVYESKSNNYESTTSSYADENDELLGTMEASSFMQFLWGSKFYQPSVFSTDYEEYIFYEDGTFTRNSYTLLDDNKIDNWDTFSDAYTINEQDLSVTLGGVTYYYIEQYNCLRVTKDYITDHENMSEWEYYESSMVGCLIPMGDNPNFEEMVQLYKYANGYED